MHLGKKNKNQSYLWGKNMHKGNSFIIVQLVSQVSVIELINGCS